MNFPLKIPFLHHLGAEMTEYGGGRCTLRLTLEPRHLNSWDVAHGGVIMTLLDAAMAIAAKSMFASDYGSPGGMLTIEMKTMFLRPGTAGELTAHGECVHKATKLAFCEGEVRGPDGKPIARASGTFKFWLPKGPRT
jgi:uncharacterized protein (TIGR00369 family)